MSDSEAVRRATEGADVTSACPCQGHREGADGNAIHNTNQRGPRGGDRSDPRTAQDLYDPFVWAPGREPRSDQALYGLSQPQAPAAPGAIAARGDQLPYGAVQALTAQMGLLASPQKAKGEVSTHIVLVYTLRVTRNEKFSVLVSTLMVAYDKCGSLVLWCEP